MTLVIMAAGMGSRYGGLKQIDPVGPSGEFIVDYSVYDAIKAGFNKVVFIIKKENLELFEQTIGQRMRGKIEVEYAFQETSMLPQGYTLPQGREKPLGTAHAVWCAREKVSEPFAVINADDFYGRDAFSKLAEFLKKPNTKGRPQYCMAGYILKNTVTENGHVSRGVCAINDEGRLEQVVERTQIQRNDGKMQYFENDEWHDVSEDVLVSMNCWGFTPDLFDAIGEGLTSFMENDIPKNPLKAEYFLPFLVQHQIDKGACDVTVLHTDAKWYGVTYKEDKPVIVAYIQKATDDGLYPKKLW